MASTEKQNLTNQSSISDLLSENENHSTITMDCPKKKTLRFESFPPEIRNMIYSHLFPPAEFCEGLKPRRLYRALHHWPDYIEHYAYVYDTAILRSNRLIGQEAKAILYGSNIFVLFNMRSCSCAYGLISKISDSVGLNFVRKGAQVPSCVVHINQGRQDGKPAGPSLIVAAADVNLICKKAIVQQFCCHGPRAAYFLVALPQLGWQHERLLTMIWLPLKALRERGPFEFEEDDHDYFLNTDIKITDCTGVFEHTVTTYKPEDFESGSLIELISDSYIMGYESDGSGSEDSESGDHNSYDEEEEEEDDSDDVTHKESDGDEASTSGESGEGDSD